MLGNGRDWAGCRTSDPELRIDESCPSDIQATSSENAHLRPEEQLCQNPKSLNFVQMQLNINIRTNDRGVAYCRHV